MTIGIKEYSTLGSKDPSRKTAFILNLPPPPPNSLYLKILLKSMNSEFFSILT
jgi:hypothetical protein